MPPSRVPGLTPALSPELQYFRQFFLDLHAGRNLISGYPAAGTQRLNDSVLSRFDVEDLPALSIPRAAAALALGGGSIGAAPPTCATMAAGGHATWSSPFSTRSRPVPARSPTRRACAELPSRLPPPHAACAVAKLQIFSAAARTSTAAHCASGRGLLQWRAPERADACGSGVVGAKGYRGTWGLTHGAFLRW